MFEVNKNTNIRSITITVIFVSNQEILTYFKYCCKVSVVDFEYVIF